MASNVDDLKKAVKKYGKKFRHPDLPALEVSGLYDLFPALRMSSKVRPVASWPEDYPFADRKGIYVIVDSHLRILYVGKASMNNWLGNRLACYFGYEKDKTCKIWHSDWTYEPRYVVTVAVPHNCGFEAPALEEYLLGEIETVDNSIVPVD